MPPRGERDRPYGPPRPEERALLRDLLPPTAVLVTLGAIAAHRAGTTPPTSMLLALAMVGALGLMGYEALSILGHRGRVVASLSLTARLIVNERGSGRHVFVFGMTGSGKTTTVKRLLASLKPPCPVLVKAPI